LKLRHRLAPSSPSFLVVRNLDKNHYAWYSLAFNLQSALGKFTLLGIGTGMTSMGGQWIAGREKMELSLLLLLGIEVSSW
jgi:hypothetical protein